MQRLGAVFIAICMVAIAASAGAVFYYKFGLSIPESAPISFGILLTLLLVHYQISRVRDRMMLDEQMDDLTRLKLGLTKELQDVREMARHLEKSVTDRVEDEMEPILAELELMGSLVKQLAESCADLDERMDKGDQQVEEVRARLASATSSVKELEELLRANLRQSSNRNSGQNQFGVAPTVAMSEQASTQSLGQVTDRHSDYGQNVAQQAKDENGNEPVIWEEDEAAVRRALALGQIELFMQPILSLPMRKPQFYEALSRLKAEDGSLITPDIFLPVCAKFRFMPMLDRLAMNEAFRLQRRLADRGVPVDCFCNLSIQSLADSDFFALMRDLFEQNRDLAEHVILEFSQEDLGNFGILEDETLQLLRSMGFRFSMDKITDLATDFDMLARKGIRFAKVAEPVLTHREAGRGLDIHPADYSRVLSRKGIELIVTHVETESTLVRLIDFNIHLAQGNHFAPAQSLKGSGDVLRSADNAASRNAPGSAATTISAPDQTERLERSSGVAGLANTRRSASMAPSTPQVSQPVSSPSGGVSRQDDTRASNNRTLGQNPRIAEALRAMASQDGGDNATREHFRTVLAEAAGLLEPAVEQTSSQMRSALVQNSTPVSAPASNRLPAADDFGLKTDTSRGQFIDLTDAAEPAREGRPVGRLGREGEGALDTGAGLSSFERLIR